MTILVFDSGIGGLSVLREARMWLVDQRMIYVGDDAGFPYGEWEESALLERIVGLFDTLMSAHQPKLAIIACNTASTMIMPALRQRFDIPFVGIVPAIKPAAMRTSSGMISILATPGTVNRRYTSMLVEQFAAHRDVTLVGATRLARLSENYMQGNTIDSDILLEEIAPCFVEREGKRTDIIALGCTHYPFLVNEMRKVAPWPVDWLDPAEAVAHRALQQLHSYWPQLKTSPEEKAADIAIMTSGKPSEATARLLGSFGFELVLDDSLKQQIQKHA